MTKQLRDLFDSLEQRVVDRTQALQNANRSLERQTLQLETSAQVSREITSILEIDQLLNHVVRLIGNAFEYDYVHIFLLDVEENQLHHRAGNMEKKPSLVLLPLNGKGINCEAIRENRYIQVDNVMQSVHYLLDDSMPDALSELVVPLRVGNQVIGTLDVLSRQIAAFSESDVLVLQSLGDQIAIAIENARLYRHSQELAVMEERTRLARNLHDSVTQSLYSLSLLVAGWQQGAREDKIEKVDNYLQRTAEITQRMLREMRLMIHEMRPPDLEEDGLVGALHKRLEAVENRAGVRTRLFAEDLVEIPVAMEEELYLIALEALNNSLKHAAASVITIKLFSDNKQIFLSIEDDGPGFDLETALKSGGLGLTNMKERAIRLGGKLTISTQENKGTTISASLPYTDSE